jgi:hypothetical protein
MQSFAGQWNRGTENYLTAVEIASLREGAVSLSASWALQFGTVYVTKPCLFEVSSKDKEEI